MSEHSQELLLDFSMPAVTALVYAFVTLADNATDRACAVVMVPGPFDLIDRVAAPRAQSIGHCQQACFKTHLVCDFASISSPSASSFFGFTPLISFSSSWVWFDILVAG